MAHVDVGQTIGFPAAVYVAPTCVCATATSAVYEQPARTRQRESSRALNKSSAGMVTGVGTDIVTGIGAIGARADISTIAAANSLLRSVKRQDHDRCDSTRSASKCYDGRWKRHYKIVAVRSGHSKARQVKRKQPLETGQMRMRSDCAVLRRFSMTCLMQERSNTQTRPWTSHYCPGYAHSCSTRMTSDTGCKLRKREPTPLSRSSTYLWTGC